MDWVYQKIFIACLNWLSGMGSDGFARVLAWVREAEATWESGADKAKFVKDQIMIVLKVTTPFLLNLITEMAVAYAKKKGWIK